MLATAKAVVKQQLLSRGHYGRKLSTRAFPGVAVLCYHGLWDASKPDCRPTNPSIHVSTSEFEDHCRVVSRMCDPIGLDDLRRALRGEATLPKRPILFTFDDGYRSVFQLARPLLEEYQVPAVVFACCGPIERRSLFWFDAVARSLGEHKVNDFKQLSGDEWSTMRKAHDQQVSDNDPNACMTSNELRELSQSPRIDIGGHTCNHPILSRLSFDQQQEEILQNRERLESWIGQSIRCFAYPNGRPELDYDEQTTRILQTNSFTESFCTRHGLATAESPWELSRFMMLSGVGASELAHRLCYSWQT